VNDLESRVLRLVGEVSGLLDIDELRDGLFWALRVELPCEYISLNHVASSPEQSWSVVDPPLSQRAYETFYLLAHQNPLAARYMRTHDARPFRLSDVVTSDEFHATDIYREIYSPLGIEYQIAFALASSGPDILAVALSRTEQDFSDTERDLLALARPHLIQIYRNALEVTALRAASSRPRQEGPDEGALRTLGLTPSEARVLCRIATGRSTPDIARELGIAQRTVHKHLHRTYRKLQVKDRSAAAERAWQAASPDSDR
jgi:DNA-binding CsgD family transcriptional regulator